MKLETFQGRIHSMDFYLELLLFGAAPVRKKDDVFSGLPLALLFYARAFIGRTDGAY